MRSNSLLLKSNFSTAASFFRTIVQPLNAPVCIPRSHCLKAPANQLLLQKSLPFLSTNNYTCEAAPFGLAERSEGWKTA